MKGITRRRLDEIELGARVANAFHAENAPGYPFERRRVIVDRANHARRREGRT